MMFLKLFFFLVIIFLRMGLLNILSWLPPGLCSFSLICSFNSPRRPLRWDLTVVLNVPWHGQHLSSVVFFHACICPLCVQTQEAPRHVHPESTLRFRWESFMLKDRWGCNKHWLTRAVLLHSFILCLLLNMWALNFATMWSHAANPFPWFSFTHGLG